MFDLDRVPAIEMDPGAAYSRLGLIGLVIPLMACTLCFAGVPLSAPGAWARTHPPAPRLGPPAVEVRARLKGLEKAAALEDDDWQRAAKKLALEFRRNAVEWGPELATIAGDPRAPRRLRAIFALRFFGTETPWEHNRHGGEVDGDCLLGKEPFRRNAEAVLRSIARSETGDARSVALRSLGSFQTWSAAEFLVDQLCVRDCEEIAPALERLSHGCCWSGMGDFVPEPDLDRGRRAGLDPDPSSTMREWQGWWEEVCAGRREFRDGNELRHDVAQKNSYWR